MSSYDDDSDQDNYAGAHGGYDDLYDDVMEEAGYDAWDRMEEFDYDEETYLFEFDPFVEYFDLLKDDSDVVIMTYESLLELAEKTCQLLSAWKLRASSSPCNEPDIGSKDDKPLAFHAFGLNMYQLCFEERADLKIYSVDKLLRILGSEDEVFNFQEKVKQMVKFLKNCLQDILESCIPSLAYPVLRILLSHLLAEKGLQKLGQVLKQEPIKTVEKEYMDKLYLSLADIYDHLKVVMFNIEPNTHSTEPSLIEKKARLLERFELLVELVSVSSHEAGLASVEIENSLVADPGGEMEILKKIEGEREDQQHVGQSDREMTEKIVEEDGNKDLEKIVEEDEKERKDIRQRFNNCGQEVKNEERDVGQL
eukprot:GFUD01112158.1.p1 GENE.GFUD01112158.1~~GFUD01112158.1.p1  ORF type:complete len:366 (+),score=112.71 GFUD01112158.1:56-1153(+)